MSSALLDNCTFTGMPEGFHGQAGATWTATIHQCSFSGGAAAVTLTRAAGNHGLVLDDCTINGTSGNAVLVSGSAGNMLLGLVGTTVTNCGGAVAFIDSSTTSNLSILGCTLVDNGPIAVNHFHTLGTACDVISGTTYGRNDGFPSIILLQHQAGAGPMTQLVPTVPNTALPGAQIVLLGGITTASSCPQ